jgi:hypothetical protein
MSSQPLVSVLVQTYNQAPYLSASIDSLLSQTLQDLELIVVDDYSTDRTAEVLKQYQGSSRVALVHNELNLGQHASTNRLLPALRGDFILFASGDDVYYPTFLERAVRAIEPCSTAGLVHVNGHFIDAAGGVLGLISESTIYAADVRAQLAHGYCLPGTEFFDWLLQGNLVASHSACLVRRTSIQRAGPFDERLPHRADWDMWLRIAVKDDAAYLAEPLVALRRHERSASVNLQYSGESERDLVRLAAKLLTEYPTDYQMRTKRRPFILVAAFAGSVLATEDDAARVVRQHFSELLPLVLSNQSLREALIVRLAVYAWYHAAGRNRNHRAGLAAIQTACQYLPLEHRLACIAR